MERGARVRKIRGYAVLKLPVDPPWEPGAIDPNAEYHLYLDGGDLNIGEADVDVDLITKKLEDAAQALEDAIEVEKPKKQVHHLTAGDIIGKSGVIEWESSADGKGTDGE
jgi:hypothetical protein